MWRPYLRARLRIAESVSPRLDLLVDSGADVCLFDAAIGEQIGLVMDPRDGDEVSVMGARGLAYPQVVTISIDGADFQTTILFVEDLPVPGLLGRKGFFDNFRVTFDHSTEPPTLAYERIIRA